MVGDRWSLLIVRDAFDGMHRFGDFQRSLGVARNILSDRLQRLVQAGILETRPASDGSAYQEYALTAKGKASFRSWWRCGNGANAICSRAASAHSRLIDRKTGKPIPFAAPLDSGGAELLPQTTEVRKVPR